MSIPELVEIKGNLIFKISIINLPVHTSMYIFDLMILFLFISIVPDFNSNSMSVFDKLNMLSSFQEFIHEKIFSNDQIKNLLSSKSEKFDVVIYEHISNGLFSGYVKTYLCQIF